ncbi:MAG TPA: hypothetical protein VND93_04490 [Myxococcales bacterium]|nr:hypothetical protein [Myxococcales bacterium]
MALSVNAQPPKPPEPPAPKVDAPKADAPKADAKPAPSSAPAQASQGQSFRDTFEAARPQRPQASSGGSIFTSGPGSGQQTSAWQRGGATGGVADNPFQGMRAFRSPSAMGVGHGGGTSGGIGEEPASTQAFQSDLMGELSSMGAPGSSEVSMEPMDSSDLFGMAPGGGDAFGGIFDSNFQEPGGQQPGYDPGFEISITNGGASGGIGDNNINSLFSFNGGGSFLDARGGGATPAPSTGGSEQSVATHSSHSHGRGWGPIFGFLNSGGGGAAGGVADRSGN